MSASIEQNAPQHAPITQFAVRDGCLLLGDTPVTALAQDAGSTPFYAYDSAVMAQSIADLRGVLPADIHLHYAIKANPMREVIEFMARHTDGLDVASAGELRRALATGIRPDRISFAGPGKSKEDLALAVEAGIIINVESEGELARIAALARESGRRPQIALRVNPDFELKSAGMKMGSGAKPFGIDAERIPAVLSSLPTMPLDFVGLHIFSGSQNLRSEAIIESQNKTLALACELSRHAPTPLRWVNIGGGLGVPYFPGENPLDLAPIGRNLATLVRQAKKDIPQAQLVMELGRYLVATAGVYICEVVDRKVSRGETFLVTNGGLHHHLAASGNFGQVIRKNYPIAVGNRMGAEGEELVNVVGPLCTPLDILGNRVRLPRAEPGDLIVVFQSGAYGFSASPRDFLGHPAPGELFV